LILGEPALLLSCRIILILPIRLKFNFPIFPVVFHSSTPTESDSAFPIEGELCGVDSCGYLWLSGLDFPGGESCNDCIVILLFCIGKARGCGVIFQLFHQY